MLAITLNYIPSDLYSRIKQSALINYRSINSEILYHLDKTLSHKPLNPDQLLERINILQKKVSIPKLSDDMLIVAKNEGRP
jgi:hypothetical protein